MWWILYLGNYKTWLQVRFCQNPQTFWVNLCNWKFYCWTHFNIWMVWCDVWWMMCDGSVFIYYLSSMSPKKLPKLPNLGLPPSCLYQLLYFLSKSHQEKPRTLYVDWKVKQINLYLAILTILLFQHWRRNY